MLIIQKTCLGRHKCIKDKAQTFTTLAKSLLLRVLKLTTHWADLCFDVYKFVSLKDVNKNLAEMRILNENYFTFGHWQCIQSAFTELSQTVTETV